MSDAEQPQVVAEDGELCFWRVFEIRQDFEDRPKGGNGDHLLSVPLSRDTDSLVVVIGAFPESVRQALLEHRTRGIYALKSITGEYRGMSIEESEEAILALEGHWNLDDLKIGEGVHMALEMRRTVSVQAYPRRHYFWRNRDHMQSDRQEFEEFAKEAAPVLDAATAWLLPALGDRLQLGRLIVEGRRPYLLVPGKAALTVQSPEVIAHAGSVSVGSWEEQPWQELAEALHSYTSHMADARALLAAPSRWLALSLGEKDKVRGFLFAYCGLETLANKVISRWRSHLAEILSQDLNGVPVGELLWPNAQDDQYPQRNLVFRFAAMATLVRRDSAQADTDIFRTIARFRNNWRTAVPIIWTTCLTQMQSRYSSDM